MALTRLPASICLSAALAALVAGSGACSRLQEAGLAGRDTVYVGVAVGLQSPERYADVFKGVELALADLNARRPADAPVLALRRAAPDVRSHVDVAAGFVADPAVIGVVGHTESEATIDAAPIYADRVNRGRRGLVAISPTANGTLVTRVNDWVFRVCPVSTQQAAVLARFAVDSLRLPSVAIVYRNDASGKDFSRAFANEFQRGGGTIIERDPFVEEFPEMDAYAVRIARRGARGVFFSGNAPEARRLLLALRAAGANPSFLSTNPPSGSDAAELRDFAGVHHVSLFDPLGATDSAATRFTRDFQRKHGVPPYHWAALAYDAASVIGRAVHAVGPDRARVRDWVSEVGRSQPAHAGVTGRIAFDSIGDPQDKTVLIRRVGR